MSSGKSKSSGLKFRPSFLQENRGGTRPTPEFQSVGFIFLSLVHHICRKTLLFKPRLKAALYLAVLFFGSLIADFFPIPRTFFSRSNNFVNQYFIKWSWAWLLTTTTPWIAITVYTIGCGRRSVLLRHLSRLILATLAWITWMKVFQYIEVNFGTCFNTKDRSLQEKSRCLQAGKHWSSLDISGHAFIIIYSCLILSEEAHSFLGWERIKDNLAQEEYLRKNPNEKNFGTLRYLSNEDLQFLKTTHKALTPHLRGLFIIMTLQQVCSEVMLMATILYYHIMIEKFIGGIVAILTWYATYHWLFKIPQLGFLEPGNGIFKYSSIRKEKLVDNYN